MKPYFFCTFALIIGLPIVADAADDDHPFKKVKEGDWVKYSMTMEIGDFKLRGDMKTTVVAKTEKEVTLHHITTLDGRSSLPLEQKIDLTRPFDPTVLLQLKENEATIKKVGDGQEKIKLGGKEYDCTLIKLKVKTKAGGKEYNSDYRVWTNKDIPLGGLAKMEVLGENGAPANTWLEFKESGSK